VTPADQQADEAVHADGKDDEQDGRRRHEGMMRSMKGMMGAMGGRGMPFR
jgi:hypothetical protein